MQAVVMCEAGYKHSLPAFAWSGNHDIQVGAAESGVMLNDGVSGTALTNVVVKTISEMLNVCRSGHLS